MFEHPSQRNIYKPITGRYAGNFEISDSSITITSRQISILKQISKYIHLRTANAHFVEVAKLFRTTEIRTIRA